MKLWSEGKCLPLPEEAWILLVACSPKTSGQKLVLSLSELQTAGFSIFVDAGETTDVTKPSASLYLSLSCIETYRLCSLSLEEIAALHNIVLRQQIRAIPHGAMTCSWCAGLGQQDRTVQDDIR